MKKKNPILMAVGSGVAIGVLAGGFLVLQTLFEPMHTAPRTTSSTSSTPDKSLTVKPPPNQLVESSKISSSALEPVSDPEPVFGEPLAENAEIMDSKDWFSDAVFVGDSLTYGISAYEFLAESRVLASVGINPQTVLSKAVIQQNAGKVTVLEALENLSPNKIYIMLGINGIAFLSEEKIVDAYAELLDAIKEQQPQAKVYVQSILPVTAEKSKDPLYSNDKIKSCNQAILELTKEKQVYYVNVTEVFEEEDGSLPEEMSKDGLHLSRNAYEEWLQYLLYHRAPE